MKQPNIVLLLLDAARADHIGAYGYNRDTTQFLDNLATRGVRYDNVYANSVFSLPSYASLFTGEYPTSHGAVDWNKRVNNNRFVSELNEAGYETTAVTTHLVTGEFGLADAFDIHETVAITPNDRLFDDDPVGERMSKRGTAQGWSSELEKYVLFLRTLVRHPSPKSAANGAYALCQKLKRKLGFWEDDGGQAVADRCKQVIRETDEPFFLFGNFVETHDPYRPPRSVRSKFLPDDATLDEVREAVEYSSVRASVGLEEMDDRRTEILKALYDAELTYVDELIEQIYTELEQQGMAKSTVFVVLSDHGDFFGEQGLWGHQGGVYDEVSRVPLIVKYPWETEEPSDGPYELRGLTDHLLSLADGSRELLDDPGEALVEYYGIDTQLSFTPWEEYESIDADEWGQYQCGYADENYRLIWDSDGETELYERADSGATTDVSAEKPSVVAEFKTRVRGLVGNPKDNHHQYRAREDDSREFEMTEDVEDRLRQLGYTE
ncbi:sulfatase [Halobellus inordinatus]|uniref:sulfatase n=1 Tax=Halobellus inordinatus TaxID=1126236 RepID=UPI0021147751|nr:sulfatase [Halobellus ramosii]